jgi:hypothetical protein
MMKITFLKPRQVTRFFSGVAISGLFSTQVLAFSVFPIDGAHSSKWGDNSNGTPGGVVTWSLMPDGTGLDPSAPSYIHDTSNLGSLMSQIDAAYGAGAFEGALTSAFAAWSSVANISFVKVEENAEVPVPFSAAYASVGPNVIGDIRIGAFNVDGFSGAVGFAPHPNGGTTLEGDIIFNLNVAFQIASAAEGMDHTIFLNPSPTDPGNKDFFYHNDLEAQFVHELGHALGVGHSTVSTALMCGPVDFSFDGSTCSYADPDKNGMIPLNRVPDADDIAGIQFLYGAPVPEASTWTMMFAGLGLVGFVAGRRNRS